MSRALGVALVLLGGWAVATGASARSDTAMWPLVVTQLPLSTEPLPALAGGTWPAEGDEGGRIVLVAPGGTPRVLTAGFTSAADPEVSFDGKQVYFAGRRASGDPWCVWVMYADGGAVRKVTCGPGGARHPIDLPPMYTLNPKTTDTWDRIAFVGRLPGEANEAGVGDHTALFACRKDGTDPRRLTFNLSSDTDPVMLPDGRIVFASWQRHQLDRGPFGRVALFGLQTDGVDLMIFAGDEGRRVKLAPAYAGDRLVVFVEGDTIGGDGSGSLGVVSLRRNLHTYRALTGPDDGRYRSPSTHPAGGVLVAWRPGPDAGTYAVTHVSAETGRREVVFDDPGWHDVQARVLAPRAVPDHRSSSVREEDPAGKLYGLDVGINDLGPSELPRGLARRVRILEGVPIPSGTPPSALAPRRLLGEVDLDEDGSFQVQVPANVPLQVQLLDEDGLALRSCGWIWVRNHEQRGCIGCHEDPERTPPNRHVRALDHPAARLDLPPEKRRRVTFDRDVRPVVETRCVSCHGASGAVPRLDATADRRPVDYRRVLGGYVVPGRARTSPIVWHLLGRRTSRPWDPATHADGAGPVPGMGGALLALEQRALIEWIDFGGAWGGEAGPTAAAGGGR